MELLMKRTRHALGAPRGLPHLLIAVALALVLVPGLALIDGCGGKKDTASQGEDMSQASSEEASASIPEQTPPQTEATKTEVNKGDIVSVQYKGTLADGSVFDQSRPDQPLVFTAGVGQMIAGFDKAVLGMKLNEKKTVTIPAAEAYGERDDSLIREVPRTNFPETFQPVMDQMVTLSNQAGQQLPGKIVGINDENITVDFNHRLAGEDLTFEITVVGIQ
jgi:FKBP-type peptidyl-prolyl cis-trans isomerase 2